MCIEILEKIYGFINFVLKLRTKSFIEKNGDRIVHRKTFNHPMFLAVGSNDGIELVLREDGGMSKPG